MFSTRLLQTILFILALAAGALAQNAAAVGPAAPGGVPLLFSAIESGDLKTLAQILAAGANPNARNAGGESPLGFAAEKGLDDAARLLVAHGADVQAADGGLFAFTPLMAAAREGHVELVDWLLGKGADAAQTDKVFGYTALLWAVKAGRPEAVRRLIANGGDANEGSHGETPLWLAAREGRTAMLALLIELGAGIDRPGGPEGEPPLNAAIRAGEEAAAAWLIDHGANPNAKSRARRTTPLMAAAKAGLPGTARRLIDHGATVEPVQDGESPLALAVLGGHLEVARLLVERGADIDRKGPGGHSPRDRARGWEWNFDALEQRGAAK